MSEVDSESDEEQGGVRGCEQIQYGAITLTGGICSFIELERRGHKIFTMPLGVSQVDDLIKALENITMCVLHIEPGSCEVPLSQSLMSEQYNLSFSSKDVTGGRVFKVKEGKTFGSLRDLLKYPTMEEIAKLREGSENCKMFASEMMRSREQFLGGWTGFTLSWINISGIAASSTDHEHVDKEVIMKTLPLFTPRPSLLFEEASINRGNKGPHGNLDLLILSEDRQRSPNRTGFLTLSKLDNCPAIVHAASTAKTEVTFGTLASERQAVLELLTLTSCLHITGDDTVMMIQVNRNKIISYLYYTKTDFLTRPTEPIMYYDSATRENGLIGCFVLFILMRHHRLLSRERLKDLKDVMTEAKYKCGWKEAVSNLTFTQCVGSQKQKCSSSRVTSADPGNNDVKAMEYLKKNRAKFMEEL